MRARVSGITNKMTALKQITKADVAAESKRVDELSLQVSSITTIKSQKELEGATAILAKVKEGQKFIAEKKEGIVGPLNTALKNARDLFRPIEEKLNVAEFGLKASILSYKQILEKKIEEEKAKITKKVESGEVSFDKGSEKMDKAEQKKEAFKTRKIKEVIIEKPEVVPKKYWAINEVMVRADALAGVKIPGVKVVEKEIVIGQ